LETDPLATEVLTPLLGEGGVMERDEVVESAPLMGVICAGVVGDGAGTPRVG